MWLTTLLHLTGQTHPNGVELKFQTARAHLTSLYSIFCLSKQALKTPPINSSLPVNSCNYNILKPRVLALILTTTADFDRKLFPCSITNSFFLPLSTCNWVVTIQVFFLLFPLCNNFIFIPNVILRFSSNSTSPNPFLLYGYLD